MNVLNFLKNFLIVVSLWTMVFEPVAFGLQSQAQFNRITQTQLKMMIVDLGLNKKMTYAQFWDRTKHLYPAQSYKEIEAYFKSQPSSVMPAFEVSYTQNSVGEKVPTLKVTDRGQTYNVQIIGELNEWARVNQVSLSESDLMRLKPAIQKLNPTTTKLEIYKKDFARFEGFPRMTPVLWKSLKPEDRAAYIVKMRLLWFEARRVLESAPEASFKTDPRRKGTKPKKTSSMDEVLKLIFGEEVQAANARQSAGSKKGDSCSPTAAVRGPNCIVAGMVAPTSSTGSQPASSYTLSYNANSPNKLVCACDYDAVFEQRIALATIKSDMDRANELRTLKEKLNQECNDPTQARNKPTIPFASQGKWVACEPTLYSYNRDTGKPFCVHTMSKSMQRATAYDGDAPGRASVPSSLQNCDEQSRLGGSGSDLMRLTEEQRIAAIEQEQRGEKSDYILTRNYLDGMLKASADFKDSTIESLLKADSKYNADIDDFLVSTQKAFEGVITEAMKSCTSSQVGAKQERNYQDACKQLHHRWLFTEKFIAKYRSKACDANSDYLGADGVVSRGREQPNKTLLNKTSRKSLSDLEVCQCKEPSTKSVKIGEACDSIMIPVITCPEGSTRPPAPPEARGERGSTPAEIICKCDNKEASFPLTQDKEKNNQEFNKVCGVPAVVRPPPPPPRDEPPSRVESCESTFPGASGLDMNCNCTSGSRSGNSPVQVRQSGGSSGGEGEIVYAKDEPTKWTCDESSFNPLWLLGGLLAFLGLKRLFKNDNKPPQCGGLNQVWNNSQCVCKFALSCPNGANPECTGCAAIPQCLAPKSAGVYPACECPNLKTCVGANLLLQGTTCECVPVEGGTVPDTCVGSACGGGTPPLVPTGR
jgi:hypothetical protein